MGLQLHRKAVWIAWRWSRGYFATEQSRLASVNKRKDGFKLIETGVARGVLWSRDDYPSTISRLASRVYTQRGEVFGLENGRLHKFTGVSSHKLKMQARVGRNAFPRSKEVVAAA